MARHGLVPDGILGWLALIPDCRVIASQALTTLLHNANRNATIPRIEDRQAAGTHRDFRYLSRTRRAFSGKNVAGSMSGPSLSGLGRRRRQLRPTTQIGAWRISAPKLAERKGADWREIRVGHRSIPTTPNAAFA